MTKPDIRDLIREEVERNAIAQALQPPPSSPVSGVQRALRHPLLLTLVAFALTTILGGLFNDAIKQRDAALSAQRAAVAEAHAEATSRRAQAYKAEDEAIAALNDFVALVYRRSVAADLMRFSLMRGAVAETDEHRAVYDQAYIDWNVSLPQNLQELRRLVAVAPGDMNSPNPYEIAVNGVIDAWFGRERACLFATMDEAVQVRVDAIWSCPDPWDQSAEEASHRVRVCARAILAGMSSDIRAVTAARAAGTKPPELDQPDHLAIACEGPKS